jgi:hypothetical protein
VAKVYNPIPDDRARRDDPAGKRPHWRARYRAGLEGQAPLAGPLRRRAAQVGMDRAGRWVAISDGGAGLEDWPETNFGRAEAAILDFYHASGRPGDPAEVWHGGGRGGAPALVASAETRGGPGRAGRTTGPERRATTVGRRGLAGDSDLLREPSASDGPPELRGQGAADRLGSGRDGVQDGRRPASEVRRHALGERGSDGVCHPRAPLLSERGRWDAFRAGPRRAA